MGASTSQEDLPKSETECLEKYAAAFVGDDYCPTAWDHFLCWPPSPPGQDIRSPCPVFEHTDVKGLSDNPELYAVRICEDGGQWANNFTNFSICLSRISELHFHKPVVNISAYIVVIFSVLSLIVLSITLFIFGYFKSLNCSRLKVHKNLCVALIMYILLILPRSLSILLKISWIDYELLCKSTLALTLFSQMAITAWMFLEGLLLHSRVTVHIFRQDAPFKVYYFIGWGLPTILVTVWVGIMINCDAYENAICWSNFSHKPYKWIITGPILIALLTNALFLVNIIRVLVTKHRACNATEALQVKKAIKATALLFPLLGLTHLVFAVNPGGGAGSEAAFWIFNSFIKSSQGLFFGILYCFMNADVQTVLKNAYHRSAVRRNPNRSRFRTIRGMSQTSNTYISNSEGNILESARLKRESRVALSLNEANKSFQAQTYALAPGEKDKRNSLTML